jgi:hypothetical protein
MSLRKCEVCGGPGPCLWEDRGENSGCYCCRTCHASPNDYFFLEYNLGVVVQRPDWERDRSYPWWQDLLADLLDLEDSVCFHCQNEIDPDTCWCGEPHRDRYGDGSHAFVPMGCNCYRKGIDSVEAHFTSRISVTEGP